MELFLRCAGLAVVGAVLTLFTKKYSGEFSALLSIAAVILMFLFSVPFLKPVLAFLEGLKNTAKLGQGMYEPVIKTMGIGFLTEVGKNICEDAGEKTLGSALGIVGGVASVYVMLPLLQSVLNLLEQTI